MRHVKLLFAIIVSACLLFACSCNNPGNSDKKNNAAQTPANDSAPTESSSTATRDSNNQARDTMVKSGDTYAVTPSQATDSMLSQLKSITSLLGKNDSGIVNNMARSGDG